MPPAPKAKGLPDFTFGQGSVAKWALSSIEDYAVAVGIQSSGKLVAVGQFGGGSAQLFPPSFALARYTTTGFLDPSFGTSGYTTTIFVPSSSGSTLYSNDIALALAVQPDDKLVVVGSTYASTALYVHFAVARYTADGLLDPTFGSGGIVSTSFPGDAVANGVVLDSVGRIVVAGRATIPGTGFRVGLARYTSAGILDATFGNGGQQTTLIPFMDCWANAVTLDYQGRILVAGTARSAKRSSFLLARYLAGGTLDTTFGTNGIVQTSFGNYYRVAEARALLVEPRTQKIVAAGGIGAELGPRRPTAARYLKDGALDASFGANGMFFTTSPDGEISGLALEERGRGLIVAGSTPFDPNQYQQPYRIPFNGGHAFIGRIRWNGALDVSFATGTSPGGAPWFFSGGSRVVGRAVLLQPDGKIIGAGFIDVTAGGGLMTFWLTRLE